MADFKLIPLDDYWDLEIKDENLVIDDGLRNAVYLSLFTDRRVEADEVPSGESDQRGWWGDALEEGKENQMGSRLWLLKREKQTGETLNWAREYASEALDWLVQDGIAQSMNVTSEYIRQGFIKIGVEIERSDGNSQYSINWNAENSREE